MFSKWRWFVLLQIFLAITTRFYQLNWGQNFTFHPDENNMAAAITQLDFHQLNPHFFAYGQFPLYLSFFSLKLLGINQISLLQAVLTLRFWSAIFSTISVYVFFLLALTLFRSPRPAFLSTLLFIFTPGVIQLSHFGTTESVLILVFLTNLWLASQILQKPPKISLLIFSGFITGIGVASKITAAIFVLPIILALMLNLWRHRRFLHLWLSLTLYLTTIMVVTLAASPYYLLSWSDFLSSMAYETEVARGVLLVFYTRQFLHTPIYVFQLFRVFPYALGLPIYLLSFIGVGLLIVDLLRRRNRFPRIFLNLTLQTWLIIFVSTLVYFLYFGQLFVKWTRFVSPIFILFPLLATIPLVKIRPAFLRLFSILITIYPGLLFFNLYFHPDVRLTSSQWMADRLPPQAVILSEGGNVIDIPLGGDFQTINFDFYTLDSDPSQLSRLVDHLSQSQYILVPSRRVFANQKAPEFPLAQKYYRALFNGQLGFVPITQFALNLSWPLDDEQAEETWSVFDHPKIRLYQKTNQLSPTDIQSIFL